MNSYWTPTSWKLITYYRLNLNIHTHNVPPQSMKLRIQRIFVTIYRCTNYSMGSMPIGINSNTFRSQITKIFTHECK